MKSFFFSKEFLHFLFALLILPFQQNIPEIVKISLAPYIYILVNAKNPNYIPTLIALVLPGSTLAYAVLLSTLLLTLLNIQVIVKSGLGMILFLSLLPLPFFCT